eukprot:Sdes_comp18428_c0_seq2m8329
MSLFYFKTFNFKINSHFDSRLLNSSTLIQSRSFHSSLIGFHQAKNVQHKTKLTKKIIHSVSGKCLSSTNWLRRKLSDRYCFEAITSNYRSRSAFKLLQMNQKFQFLKKGFTVIDLGSAPGGWCQVASDAVRSLPPLDSPLDPRRKTGKVIGVDLKYMQPIAGVTLLENSDITKESTFKELQRHLNGKFANVILCD